VVVPRLVLSNLPATLDQPPADRWAATAIALPPSLSQRRYRDVLSGKEIAPGEQLQLDSIASGWCAVLLAQ